MTVSYDAVEVGTELPEGRYQVRRADLVRYAGASGDFNPIHWSERTARSVGLPNVIAHGMYTMALAGRMLTDSLSLTVRHDGSEHPRLEVRLVEILGAAESELS